MDKRIFKVVWPGIFIIVCGLYIFCCWFKQPITTVILVRHADRLENQDQLSSLGLIRANELSRILDDADISAIFTTNFNRTKNTAQPLALATGLATINYNAADIPALISLIKTSYYGKTVLVVGHSNTVPETIYQLGISPRPPDIAHDSFDQLFFLTMHRKSRTKLTKLEYGADTP